MHSLIHQDLWVEPELTLLDGTTPVTFTLQDCFNYHGYDAVGGVVLGFRLLQLFQSLISDEQLVQRRDIALFTSFPGLGARDVFELCTKMYTEHRYHLDENYHHPDANEGVTGDLYFKFYCLNTNTPNTSYQLTALAGSPSNDFIQTGRATKRPNTDDAVLKQWTALKYQLANTLLQNRAQDVLRQI